MQIAELSWIAQVLIPSKSGHTKSRTKIYAKALWKGLNPLEIGAYKITVDGAMTAITKAVLIPSKSGHTKSLLNLKNSYK